MGIKISRNKKKKQVTIRIKSQETKSKTNSDLKFIWNLIFDFWILL